MTPKRPFLILFLLFAVGLSATVVAQSNLTADNALESYLNNGDQTYEWVVTDTFETEGVRGYQLILTSQKWREYTWKHQLTVFAPAKITQTESLLFISGGSNKDSQPNLRSNQDELSKTMAHIAATNSAIVSLIRQVPNQPLYGNKTEDVLISYTLHNFTETGDYTWPLLFPMVKSVMKGMQAVQEFSKQRLHQPVNEFVLSGLSKRGWTTWLTGANDDRVIAIAPMVIDVLNMPVSLQYHLEAWNEYSPEINDYVSLGIPQASATESGQKINAMVDPYSYRANLDKPKMIFIGTNDPYWPVDAIKHYIDSIPGQNFIHYVPNAGHDIDDHPQTFKALNAFFGFSADGKAYPACDWAIDIKGKEIVLTVTPSPKKLVDATLWLATSADRDFRDEVWVGKSLNASKAKAVVVKEAYPASGFKAFYVDLKYLDTTGNEFTESTRMLVANPQKVFVD
ncbi:PhoPQ-activated protein PqaA family protein [uncultured Imperialibacter sp.]|uniref:PhoPQ-activated pathogenicity-related family protein n=1 Tax=uncultured Imperialibacter sp. TaxID=1672639 RepID=UPI0030DA8E38|tara:strand:+ start:425 stop:1786 length:1362 start_codon:yes stop_codon:yes gene_type:complete